MLHTEAARAATSEILELHSIPAPVSRDLAGLLPPAAAQAVVAAQPRPPRRRRRPLSIARATGAGDAAEQGQAGDCGRGVSCGAYLSALYVCTAVMQEQAFSFLMVSALP